MVTRRTSNKRSRESWCILSLECVAFFNWDSGQYDSPTPLFYRNDGLRAFDPPLVLGTYLVVPEDKAHKIDWVYHSFLLELNSWRCQSPLGLHRPTHTELQCLVAFFKNPLHDNAQWVFIWNPFGSKDQVLDLCTQHGFAGDAFVEIGNVAVAMDDLVATMLRLHGYDVRSYQDIKGLYDKSGGALLPL